jgi:hypothetical protein
MAASIALGGDASGRGLRLTRLNAFRMAYPHARNLLFWKEELMTRG